MSDLRELYQEVIIDHGRRPRNFYAMEDADRSLEGFNPLCGDRLTLFLRLDGDTVKEASFQGSGCAISTASASMLTETVVGRTAEEAEQLASQFHDVVTGQRDPLELSEVLGKLTVLTGVRDYPSRVKCATLAWHTLNSALEGSTETVVTE